MTIKWDQHSHNMLQGNLNWIWNFAQYLENSFLWAVIGAHSQLSEPSHCLDFLPQMKAPHTRVSESENQFSSSHSPHRCFHDDLCVHGLRLWAASAKLWMIGSDIGDIAEKFFFFSLLLCSMLSIVVIFDIVRTRLLPSIPISLGCTRDYFVLRVLIPSWVRSDTHWHTL